MFKIDVKNGAKNVIYKWSKIEVQNWRKSMPKWPPKNSSKSELKIDFRGGGPGGSKWSKIDVWDPGG
jgi:hypothetical protein